MNESERTPSLQKDKEIRWEQYNYPPLIRIIHFDRSEVPRDKKFMIYSLFSIHLVVLGNCFLNFIDNCIEGGMGILYSLLFMLAFNPIVLLVFYKAYYGLCKDKSKLKLYFIIQPILIIIEVTAAIVDFLGFNGFAKTSSLFSSGHGGVGALSLVVSFIFLAVGILSILTYVLVLRERRKMGVSE